MVLSTDLSNVKEGVFYCDKLNRTCVISVRDRGKSGRNKNYICLFVKNKVKESEGLVKDINSKDINKINLAENNILKG